MISKRLKFTLYVFVIVGIATLLFGIFGISSQRVWQAYLVNFVFWSGVAQGGIVFSAAYRLTNGKWGASVSRVGEGFVLFVLLNVFFALVALLGRHYLWPWVDYPIPEKEVWLNQSFFALRVIFYFSFMALLSIWYVYHSIRPELGLMKERGINSNSKLVERITRGWKDYETELKHSDKSLSKLSPLLLLSYAVVYSMVSFDVVMTLDPHWYSTLYGWLHFVHEFYAGVGMILLVTILTRRYFRLEDKIKTSEFYDASRLLMGLGLLSGGFYWAQFLVIWYGNLEEEIGRLIIRFHQQPWITIQWIVILVLYIFPLIVFLSRSIKEKPNLLIPIISIILSGIWLYQFIEIVPCIWKESFLPIGLVEIGMTLGFVGIFALCFFAYLKRIPLITKK